MNTLAPTRPTALHRRHIPLAAGPAAAGRARHQVEEAISSWDVPVDPDIAVLLTSELVTNAIRYEAGETVVLAIACGRDELRVDVHDTSCILPVPADAPADAETGRGLTLVNALSAEWGSYRTPAGKAVYFTLAFESRARDGSQSCPAGCARTGTPRRKPTMMHHSR